MRRAGLSAVAVLALAGACGGVEAERPANLLLVTLDSVRPERFAHPERYCELPLALAHLADEAVTFSHCVATAPGTLPAAASILTGRTPRALGRPAPGRALPGDVPTLAELLSEAGFDTAAFVAPASLAPGSGIERGFALYRGPETESRLEDYQVTDAARDWLREPQRERRRWFLWVHLNAGHGPYRALETAFNPLNFFYKYAVPPAEGGGRRIPFARGNSGAGGVPEYQRVAAPAVFRQYAGYYDARVRVGDWFANELRHVLRITGQYGRTAIAVVGTHGEALGEHGVEFDHGENLFAEVLDVPLLVQVPGRAAGVVGDTVSQVDLLPTLVGAMGLSPPACDGSDLFAGGSAVALSELYPPLGPEEVLAATSGTRKVVRTAAGDTAYDLARDPGELAGRPARGDDPLVLALDEHEASPAPPVEPRRLAPRELGRLHALGYVIARFER